MFLAVVIHDCKTNICIPENWCLIRSKAQSYNYGLSTKKIRKIFFSKDDSKVADFSLPTKIQFDSEDDSCYWAQIKKSFDVKSECEAFVSKQRRFFPPVYNLGKHEHDDSEIEKQLNHATEALVKVKQERCDETDMLRAAVFKLLPLLPTIDLTESDVEDYQDIIDEDVEDIELNIPQGNVSSNGVYQDEVALRERVVASSSSSSAVNNAKNTQNSVGLNDEGVDVRIVLIFIYCCNLQIKSVSAKIISRFWYFLEFACKYIKFQ